MTMSLRVQSHIIGATCFVGFEKQAIELQRFYSRMFDTKSGTCLSSGGKFVREIEPSLLEPLGIAEGKRTWFTQPKNHKALWIPHVAVSNLNDVMAAQGANKYIETIATISSSFRDPRGAMIAITNPEHTNGESLPFVLVDVAPNAPVFEHSKERAPFPMQPKTDGVVNWCDFLVENHNNQRDVAKVLNEAFGWNMATPIRMPGNGEYITFLNDTGEDANRHKLGGMLPKNMLLPKLVEEAKGPGAMSVPFLSCHSKQELEIKAGMAVKHGGEMLVPIMQADGDVCIIRDPCGGVVGLFHRTDDWDVTKPSTTIVPPSQYESVEAVDFHASQEPKLQEQQ